MEDKPIEKPKRGRPKKVVIVGEPSEVPLLVTKRVVEEQITVLPESVKDLPTSSETLSLLAEPLEKHPVLRADKYGTRDEQILYYSNLVRQIETRRQKRYDVDVYEHLIRNKRTITEEIDLVKAGKSHLPLRLRNHILTMKVL